jgi:hypothetical protein
MWYTVASLVELKGSIAFVLSNSKGQIPAWEVDSCSAGQEIPQPFVETVFIIMFILFVMSQMNSCHTLTLYFCNIPLNMK